MTEETISKLIEESRELRALCRERYNSARMRKEHPIDCRCEKDEECLKCKGNIDDPEIVCIYKYQLQKVEKQIEILQELPEEKENK
jgi:hypothetical protein